MPTVTDEFFATLAGRHEPLLEHAEGTVRFDITDNAAVSHHYVTLHNGDVKVSESAESADCVVTGSRKLFDAIGIGATSAMTAYLRGELTAYGDLELLVLFQRVFPRKGKAPLT